MRCSTNWLLGVAASVFLALGCSANGSDRGNDVANGSDGGNDVASLSCSEIDAEISEESRVLTTDCATDADCGFFSDHECDCPRVVATDAISDRLAVLLEAKNQCPQAACNNVPFCGWEEDGGATHGFAAVCVESSCTAVPEQTCDAIEANPAGGAYDGHATRCSTDDDCVVRSDTNACGCPEAVDTRVADVVAVSLERADCDVDDICATLDCAAGTRAICNADSRCELTE